MVHVSAKWLELLAVAVGGVGPRSQLNDGIPKTVTFTLDEAGQIIRRDETHNSNDIYQYGDPHEVWYRFAGPEWRLPDWAQASAERFCGVFQMVSLPKASKHALVQMALVGSNRQRIRMAVGCPA